MLFDFQPILSNQSVLLRPLCVSDYDDLFKVASDPEIWIDHPNKDRYKESVFVNFFDDSLSSGGALLIIDQGKGEVIGSSRYNNYDYKKSEVEIGWTFLARAYWGGEWNKCIKELMISHALKYVSNVVFLVDIGNIRSQRALEKIGAISTKDRKNGSGILNRCYMIGK